MAVWGVGTLNSSQPSSSTIVEKWCIASSACMARSSTSLYTADVRTLGSVSWQPRARLNGESVDLGGLSLKGHGASRWNPACWASPPECAGQPPSLQMQPQEPQVASGGAAKAASSRS